MCQEMCSIFPCLYPLSWLHCELYLLGPEKPKTCKAKLVCIKLTGLFFVRNLVSFSIFSKLLVNIIVYETKTQHVKVLHWFPFDPNPNYVFSSKYQSIVLKYAANSHLKLFSCLYAADPNFYSKNLLFLGKTYLKLNNKKMALLWLSKAKEYPAQTEEDKQVGS